MNDLIKVVGLYAFGLIPARPQHGLHNLRKLAIPRPNY